MVERTRDQRRPPGPPRRSEPGLPRFFAACARGLEEVLAGELRGLGAADVEVRPGGCAFAARHELARNACLWLRTAIRVQELVIAGLVRSRQDLHRLAARVPWDRYLGVDQTLAVDASLRDSAFTHPGATALTVKDAVADWFRERSGKRPSVDRDDPVLQLRLAVIGDEALLYRDLGGESLHKRGWRPVQVKSPLNEAVAAGLLLLSGWSGGPVADPMCGSATFLIEAALMAADAAPGLGRRFAFERWPGFDAEAWRAIREAAAARRKPVEAIASIGFSGADRHAGAIAIAERSIEAAGLRGAIRVEVAEAAAWAPPSTPRWVFVNPPWGVRLDGDPDEPDDAPRAWRDLGRFLRERCAGAQAFVLSGNAELTRHLGLRASQRWPIKTGPIDCRWLRYEIRAGDGAPPPPPPRPQHASDL